VVLILLALTAWGRGTAPAGAAPQRIAAGSATATPTPTAGPSTQTGPTVPIIVKFKAGTNAAAMDATVGTAGGKTVRTHSQIRTRVINVPAAERDTILAAFKNHGNVERATAAIKLGKASGPNDPAYPQQWALPKIAWDTAYGSVSISGTATISVLDTGIDAAHPDLAGNVVAGQSFLGTDPNSDPNGHGTALAGIAAASTNNSTGMAGVAWKGASVSSVQVLGADGTGYDSDVMSGILWAADNGASVILMGFSSGSPDNAIGDAVSYAQSKGATLVAATGNDGSTAATYPAAIAGVIGVAATDQNDAVASFSNTGSAAVAAPGVGIYATAPGGGYTTVNGTSAAAAETAGLAALLSASGKGASAIASQITGTADSIARRLRPHRRRQDVRRHGRDPNPDGDPFGDQHPVRHVHAEPDGDRRGRKQRHDLRHGDRQCDPPCNQRRHCHVLIIVGWVQQYRIYNDARERLVQPDRAVRRQPGNHQNFGSRDRLCFIRLTQLLSVERRDGHGEELRAQPDCDCKPGVRDLVTKSLCVRAVGELHGDHHSHRRHRLGGVHD